MKHFGENFLNPSWRVGNLYRIVDKNSRLVNFRPNKIQNLVNQNNGRRKMILKARQIGSTTNETIKLLDATIFNRNTTSCIIAHKDDSIKKIFRIPARAYRYMPPGIRPPIGKGGGSRYEMIFPGINSLIYCDLESRGDTITRLLISEGAFIPWDRFVAIMQAVPVNGMVTIESTPNGVGNWFYDLWTENDEYQKIFFPWYFDQGYQITSAEKITLTDGERKLCDHAQKAYGIRLSHPQIKFRRSKIKVLKEYFYQEYPEDPVTCFLLSGGAVIDRLLILDLMKLVKDPAENKEGLQIFSRRVQNDSYVIGADPAEGVGSDYSVGVCYHVPTMEEVAFLRGQFKPIVFAKKLKEMADLFSTGLKVPLLAVEKNNHGHAVLQELKEHIHYPRLYESKPGEPGWATNSLTRPLMVDQAITAIEERNIRINSLETLRECQTLVDKNGKIQAASGKHDDAFMATAIAVQMLKKESAGIRLYENVASSIMV